MTSRMWSKKWVLALGAALVLACVAVASTGFRPTAHGTVPSAVGVPRTMQELAAVVDLAGPVTVGTVVGAEWEVPRSGLINLEHATVRQQGLEDGLEPIEVYFHAIRHPTRGLFIVDTGLSRGLVARIPGGVAGRVLRGALNLDALRVRTETASWLEKQSTPLAGVFLTHLHLDHISGLSDVPRGTPLYAGPGETRERKLENLFAAPLADAQLDGHDPIREWQFAPAGEGLRVIDIFGDSTVFALHVPGHTAGSTAYLARTPEGAVLMVGDACHTHFGWEHGVEPGVFSSDIARGAESLRRLRDFAKAHRVDVRLGHQTRAMIANINSKR